MLSVVKLVWRFIKNIVILYSAVSWKVSILQDCYFFVIANDLFIADFHGNRSIGGKKPKYIVDEGPSLTELSGYNPKRQEFDPEYDNDAEHLLADMEFKEADSETERNIKLRILQIYASR